MNPLVDARTLVKHAGAPLADVASVRVVAQWGHSCVIQRLALHRAEDHPHPVRTVVAKGPATSPDLLAFKEDLGLPRIEAALYALPPDDVPGRPELVAAVPADAEARSFTLVMHDVNGRPPAGPGHLDALLHRVAALHARWWGRIPSTWDWLPPENAPHRAAFLTTSLTSNGSSAAQAASWLVQRLGARLAAYLDLLPAALDHLSRPPRTLVHGDLHTGNVLVTRDGDYRVLDWEAATQSRAAVDLAFLLISAGAGSRGPAGITAACGTYLTALQARGVQPPPDFTVDVWVAVLSYFLRRLAMRANYAHAPDDTSFRTAVELLSHDEVALALDGWAGT